MLIQNECFTVRKIISVANYSPKYKKINRFPGKLPTHELLYFYIGNVWLEFGGRRLFVKTGDIVYLPKGIENNCYCITADDRFGIYAVYFDTDDAMPDSAVHIRLKNDSLKTEFASIHRIWVGKNKGYYYKILQIFYGILYAIEKTQSSYSKSMDAGVFAKAEEYMASHYCDSNFNYAELAKFCGLSYSYFKKLFIAQYGVCPVKHITALRMNYARELLSIGKYKISDIAALCGYENVYYFSNVFKKHTGLSPKNYIAK
ncbi:MAG: helix-turn-helix transcriptional regulator [Oscillospiraceae bacterium]|nr:helix-turn-helix transcriptional regulator [Oscillospiraceae bacterium]